MNFNITRKGTGLKSLLLNCWKINQATSKCQIEFLDKTCEKVSKTETVSTIEFFIFKIVFVKNFGLTLFRMERGMGKKAPPTSIFPVISTNVGVSPQNSLTFSLNLFATML